MGESTLKRTGETPPGLWKGHGTSALGPSDSSDSGSDVQGGPGLADGDDLGLVQGTTSDPERATDLGAGADLGDADLDGDSDRFGTGERATAGRDAMPPADRMLHDDDGREIDGEDLAVDAHGSGPEDGDDAGPGAMLRASEADDDANLDTTQERRGGAPGDGRGNRASSRRR